MLGGNHERDEVVERLAADLAEARATIVMLRERIALLESNRPRAGYYEARPLVKCEGRPYVPGE